MVEGRMCLLGKSTSRLIRQSTNLPFSLHPITPSKLFSCSVVLLSEVPRGLPYPKRLARAIFGPKRKRPHTRRAPTSPTLTDAANFQSSKERSATRLLPVLRSGQISQNGKTYSFLLLLFFWGDGSFLVVIVPEVEDDGEGFEGGISRICRRIRIESVDDGRRK